MSHADKDDVKNILAGKSFFILYIFYLCYIYIFFIFSIFLFFYLSIFQFLYFSIFYVCCALIRMIARACRFQRVDLLLCEFV